MFTKYLEPRSETPGDVRITVATDLVLVSQTGNVIAVHRDDIDQLIGILQQAALAADLAAEEGADHAHL